MMIRLDAFICFVITLTLVVAQEAPVESPIVPLEEPPNSTFPDASPSIVPWVTAPWSQEATNLAVFITPGVCLFITLVILSVLEWLKYKQRLENQPFGV